MQPWQQLHAKSQLIRKDPDARNDWEQEKKGGDRRWDGWMASPTQGTWIWANSGRQWRTGKPGRLQSMGSQSRTRLSNWTATTTYRYHPSTSQGTSAALRPLCPWSLLQASDSTITAQAQTVADSFFLGDGRYPGVSLPHDFCCNFSTIYVLVTL